METIARRREALAAPLAVFELQYNSRAITAEIAPYVTRFAYTDPLSDKTDELEIELEDTDGRWLNAWYPEKGATLVARMGYAGQELIRIGAFVIGEIELSGPPSVVTIRAQSASASHPVRTRTSAGYEKTTLAAIVSRIAKRHGMTVVGKIEDIRIERITQYGETDLAFLRRVAQQYGYLVKVQTADKKLVFSHRGEVYEAEPVRHYRPGDTRLIDWRLTDKIMDVPKESKASGWSAKDKAPVVYTVVDGQTAVKGGKDAGSVTSADRSIVTKPAANAREARAKASADQQRKALERTTADITLYGDPALAAGQKVTLDGLGMMNGGYTCTQATHEISRGGGYTTRLELKRVVPTKDARKGTGSSKKTGGGDRLKVYGQSNGQTQVVRTVPKPKESK